MFSCTRFSSVAEKKTDLSFQKKPISKNVGTQTESPDLDTLLAGFPGVSITRNVWDGPFNSRDDTSTEGVVERYEINELIRYKESGSVPKFSLREIKQISSYFFTNARFDLVLTNFHYCDHDFGHAILTQTKKYNLQFFKIKFSELVLLSHIFLGFEFTITTISGKNPKCNSQTHLEKHINVNHLYKTDELNKITKKLIRRNLEACMKLLALTGAFKSGICTINFLNSTRRVLFNLDVISVISEFLTNGLSIRGLSIFRKNLGEIQLINPENEDTSSSYECVLHK